MMLILGVIVASPAGGVQEREVSHVEIDLVDFQPLDSTDHEEPIDESDGQNGASVEPPVEGTDETEGTQFSYENCDAARDAGAAPVGEDDHGFAPHLDGDNDGVGCESPAPPADEPIYENCDAARDAGAAPVHKGEHGYAPHLDRDSDGIGCELGR